MIIDRKQYALLLTVTIVIVPLAVATPLHDAVRQNRATQVTALLATDADVNAQDDQGNTPLHIAAAHYASTQLIRILLGAGAQGNRLNNAGENILEYTIYANRGGNARAARIAPLLLEAGAPISLNDDDGQRLLRLTIGWKNDALAKELLNRGTSIRDDTSPEALSSNMPLLWDAQAVQRHYLLRNWAFVLEQNLSAITKPEQLPTELVRLLRTFATEAEPRSEQEHWKCEAELDRRGLLGPREYGH